MNTYLKWGLIALAVIVGYKLLKGGGIAGVTV